MSWARSGVAKLLLAVAAAALASGCDSGGGGKDSSPVLLVMWSGDFEQPARPLRLRPGEIPVAFGPPALEYIILRLAPDGSLVAAVVGDGDGPVGVSLISLDDSVEPRTIEAGDLAQVQDLAWSPDGSLLAVVRPTSVLLLAVSSGLERGAFVTAGRLFGPLGGDAWAPDSSALALGVSDGIVIIRPDTAPELLTYEGAPFEARAAAFGGWLEGELLVRDLSTGVLYSHPPGAARDHGWRATVSADPQAAFVALLESAAAALYEEFRGATITSTRPTADRSGAIVTGWTAESEAAIRQGPFQSAAAVAIPGAEPVVFALGKVASFGLVQEGRLIDAVVEPP